MSERPEHYAGTGTVIIEKWITFLQIDGRWNFQLWVDHEPATGKVYKLKVQVPQELIGADVPAEISEAKK